MRSPSQRGPGMGQEPGGPVLGRPASREGTKTLPAGEVVLNVVLDGRLNLPRAVDLLHELSHLAENRLVVALDVLHLVLRHELAEAPVQAAVHHHVVAGVVQASPALWHDVVDVVHLDLPFLALHRHLLGHVAASALGVWREEVPEFVAAELRRPHVLENRLDFGGELARRYGVLLHVLESLAEAQVDRVHVNVLLLFKSSDPLVHLHLIGLEHFVRVLLVTDQREVAVNLIFLVPVTGLIEV
mmetsp:Transcript_27620/g.92402  ORF Transcript_27620/g.92402 Transcript_27620/m.92402 type:complete len:243 (+) Transcript_27620:149-877(+)